LIVTAAVAQEVGSCWNTVTVTWFRIYLNTPIPHTAFERP
jgi:hypothetical protein